MRKFCICMLMFCMFFLMACSNEGNMNLQSMKLEGIDRLYIDHGSTPVHIESAEVDALEAFISMDRGNSGIVMAQKKKELKIQLKSDLTRIIKIGRKPWLTIRVPMNFEGEVLLSGSSGNVKINDLQASKLNIDSKSGNVSMDYQQINQDIHVSVYSGHVILNLKDKDSNVKWRLKSGSGRRSVSIPWDERQDKQKSTEGLTGNGSFDVYIETRSGNISIKE
ncbi:DUF4097 family beta strand repeat-containing protein [Paenibacillus humicus]|uniref:DUF4097 family beta strand repeat-containing protein n=1 Tax=Paenibacillus humicus TaxID=412861 RepID=UPI003D282D84